MQFLTFNFLFIYLFIFAFWVTPGNAQGSSWLCTQESLLAVLGGPYGMLGIEPGSAACKAHALPAVLSLQPAACEFLSLPSYLPSKGNFLHSPSSLSQKLFSAGAQGESDQPGPGRVLTPCLAKSYHLPQPVAMPPPKNSDGG